MLLQCHRACWTTWRKPWRRWKEKNQLQSWHCAKLQVKKLRLPPNFRESVPETPGHPLTLTMQRGNYINLVAFWIVARSQRAMKSVKHRKLSCYCPVPKKGSNTVRFTFAFLTLARVSLSVSLFFSPLSLRRGVVVVCFEVIIGELLCLTGLRHVISGILAGGIPGWGDPWFPHGAFVASLAFWYGLVFIWCSSLCFCCHTMSRWYNVIISCMN